MAKTFNVLNQPEPFVIDMQYEQNARPIAIKFGAWVSRYGNGTISATVQRAGDSAPYPVVLEVDDNTAVWNPSATDTEKEGRGTVQFSYSVDDVIVKSTIWEFIVKKSHAVAGEAPDGYTQWMNDLQAKADETLQNATAASASADRAEEAADEAQQAVGDAETFAETASTKAQESAQSALNALTAQRAAENARDSVVEYADDAAQSAQDAQNAASNAQTSAEAASINAQNAAQSAANAATSAGNAEQAANSIKNLTANAETLPEDSDATASYDPITGVLTIGTPRGKTGATGPKGDTGADGFSPIIDVTEITGGHKVSVTDAEGTQTFDVMDGVSPVLDDEVSADSANGVKSSGIYDAIINLLPVDTASGAIASFPDGADDVPMLSLKAQIEPVQDLHGYDNPWPAGGGKNLLQTTLQTRTLAGVTATVREDGYITLNGTSTDIIYLVINDSLDTTALAGKLFKANAVSGVSYRIGSSYSSTAQDLGGGSTETAIVDNGSGLSLFVRIGNNVVLNNVAIQPRIGGDSSAVAAWTPYSNECPITGHTGATVEHTGVNMWNQNVQITLIKCYGQSGTGQMRKGVEMALPSGTYTISLAQKGTAGGFIYYNRVTQDGAFSAFGYITTGASSGSRTATITLEEGERLIVFDAQADNESSVTHFGDYDIQIEVGAATDYEQYQGETIQVSWESETGTVYSGELDVTTGVLTVDRAYWKKNTSAMNNDENFPGWKNAGVRDIMGSGIDRTFTGQTVNVGNAFAVNTTYDILYMPKSGTGGYNKTQTEWQALALDVEILIPYATSQTYQLTPQEVRTFLGQNNIWNDCGDTKVTYRADIQKYIDKKTGGGA